MKKTLTLLISVLTIFNCLNAQSDTMYVLKNGAVIYQEAVTNIDSIIFYNSTNPSLFACGTDSVQDSDGNWYKTVQIGTQCWMAENLNVGTMIGAIPNGALQTNNNIREKYCYNNDTNNCKIYGGLYEWNETIQYGLSDTGSVGTTQGVCPVSWHIPTDKEWTKLTDALGGVAVAGAKMKEVGTAHWTNPNVGATDSSGFTALPGGWRYFASFGAFSHFLDRAHFWSATEGFNNVHGNSRRLDHDRTSVQRYISSNSSNKNNGFSVRCVKD